LEAEDKTNDKTNSQSLGELLELRLRIAELEETQARRQRVDKALRLSEKYFRTLIENTLDVITMLDKDGVITYQSPSMERVLGYGEEELLGKNVLQYIHPDDSAMIVGGLASIVDSPDDIESFKFRFRNKDGSWCDLEGTGKAIIEGSELIGIILSSRDISRRKRAEEELREHQDHLEDQVLERTAELEKANYFLQREIGERKQTEAALQRSEKYYRSLVEKSFDFVSVLNADASHRYISPSVEKITGYKSSELMDLNPFELMHPDDVQDVMKAFSHIIQEPGHEEQVEYRIRRKDGSSRFLEAVGKNLLDDPAVQGVVVNTRDITERKQAELEKQRSEEYFQELFKNAHDLIFVVGEDGLVKFVNSAIEPMLGYKVEEIIGKDAFEPVHPDDIQKIAEAEMEADQPQTMETRVRHKNGSWRWHGVTATNLIDHPAVGGLVINARDITDRKLAEEALRKSEEKFRSIADAAMDAVLSIDSENRIYYMNAAGERIFGYTAQEVAGKEMYSMLIPERFREVFQQGMEAFRATGAGQFLGKTHEFPALKKDGIEFLAEVSISSYRVEDSTHFVAIVRDVTERTRMEEELRESEEKYRELVENVNDVILTIDTQGVIQYISPAVERLSGFMMEELIGQPFTSYVHPDDLQVMVEDFFESLQGKIEPTDFRILDKDGSIKYVRASSRPMMKDGEMVGLTGILTDITDRKLAEEALRESEEKFRSLIENAMDIITILDNEGRITYVSPSVEKTLGYEVDDLMGENVFDLIHEKDLEKALAAFERGTSQPGAIEHLETSFPHNDGSWRVLEVTGYNLLDEPSVGGVVINAHDITERKRMEEFLKESEAQYRDLVENINDAIFRVDPQGVISYISPAIEKIGGYKPMELVGHSFIDYVHPDDLHGLLESMQHTLEGELEPYEYRVFDKDGNERYIRTSSRPVFEQGQLTGITGVLTDITERKKAEEALKESESKFRILSEQSIMGIFVIQDDLIKYANKAGEVINEYSVEEALNWGPMEYTKTVYPDDRSFVAEQVRMKQSGEEGYIKNYSYRLLTKTGKVKWVEIYSKTVIFEGRTADLVTMTDVTDRVHMQEELKHSEEHFRSLIENASDVIVTINQEGMVSYVSPSVERVLGYTPEEVLDDVGFGLIHPDDLQKTVEMYKQIVDNPDKTFLIELRVQHKDGSWRDIDINVRNLLDYPAVRAIVANYRDITDRRLMRERLESINHLFLSLGVDLIANMERIVEAARYILGGVMATYSRTEKQRFSILSTAPGEDGLIFTERPEDYACFEVISRSTDEPLHIQDLEDSEYCEKDPLVAKYGLKSYLGYPVKTKQRVTGCLGIFFKEQREFSHDDLEIMGMLARSLSGEEERLSHEESLKDFIDIASHELRHPITLMKGYALTMRDNEDKIDASAKKNFLGIINEAADRLSMLVKELLDVSRIERGRFSIDRQNMRLQPLFDRAVEEMREKGCENVFQISLSEEVAIWSVDPEKLIGVLVILMDNAVSHSPNSSNIEVMAVPSDGAMLVSVLDRGKGVPERDRKLIFERFYQVEDALHHSSTGMGLGLYIAKEIVEGHGGKIWCEPREGGGSAFRFTIP
jgi:PAS domain S-box-containing protein